MSCLQELLSPFDEVVKINYSLIQPEPLPEWVDMIRVPAGKLNTCCGEHLAGFVHRMEEMDEENNPSSVASSISVSSGSSESTENENMEIVPGFDSVVPEVPAFHDEFTMLGPTDYGFTIKQCFQWIKRIH